MLFENQHENWWLFIRDRPFQDRVERLQYSLQLWAPAIGSWNWHEFNFVSIRYYQNSFCVICFGKCKKYIAQKWNPQNVKLWTRLIITKWLKITMGNRAGDLVCRICPHRSTVLPLTLFRPKWGGEELPARTLDVYNFFKKQGEATTLGNVS